MIDSHCHLNDEALYEKRKLYVDNALASGVTLLLVVGWDLESSKKAVSIAHEFDSVYAAVGFHPENLEDVSDEKLHEIEKLASDERVIAIGEIGLDYYWNKEEDHKIKQKEWFVKQIELANRLNLPLSIHSREASEDTFNILNEHRPKAGAVLHCYSGSPEMMDRFLKLGLYFGFDGPITFKNAVLPKENVKKCPLDRILTETDSPYLSPVPYRGKTNEPSRIKEILEYMTFLKNLKPQKLEEQVALNFYNLFHVKHE